MEKTCNIVGDLLPLYHEAMVSEDTREYVADHLRGFAHCRTALTRLQSGNIPTQAQEEREAWQKVARILRRKLRGRNIGNKIVGAVLALLLVLGFLAQRDYFHVTGEAIPGVEEITPNCTARIQHWEKTAQDGLVEAGEYAIEAGAILELKQLLQDTEFTRKLHSGVIYGRETDADAYMIVVSDTQGGEYLSLDYTWGWKVTANTMPGQKDIFQNQYLKIDDPEAFQAGLQSILDKCTVLR